MSIPRALVLAAIAAAAALAALPAAAAITVDGQLDAEYLAPLVIQTTQTGLGTGQITGDNNLGDLNFANGSELDAAYAFVSGGTLRLFLPGNLALVLNVNQNKTIGHVLDLFVDSGPGGQNMLNGLGAGNPLNGLTFDAGFEADHLFQFSGDGNQFSVTWRADYAALSAGGGTLSTLGYGSAGPPGTLSGGTNPFGVKATIDNRNTAGVGFGCNAASGAGATMGMEWEIPLAAIGNPAGCFKVAALVRDAGATQASMSNQSLAPLPPGTCPPGTIAFVNFASYAGDQFFSVCPGVADVAPGAGARLALSLAGANPARGDRLRFAYALPDARPATLQLFDCAGRLLRSRALDGGSGMAELSAGRSIAPGLYWARLSQGAESVVRTVCVVR